MPLSTGLFLDSLITGFQFSSSSHTINLFADDVILILTNSATSLPQAHEILTTFGEVSYYKVNFTKSLILDLGVPPHKRKLLQSQMPYTWRSGGITYLGITLTNKTSTLVKSNMIPLIAKLEAQIRNMSNKEISWLGRITAYKMMILPQILYIFRTLPIHIPLHYIHNITKLGWRYIWNGKKARCSRNNLMSHKKIGGAGLADLYDYYWAVRLDQTKLWLKTEDTPLWVDIETSLAPTKDLTLILLSDGWFPWKLSSFTPPMQISLRAWRFILAQKHNDIQDIQYTLPLTLLETKIPLLKTKHLTNKGITNILDLYNGTQLKPIDQIMTQYNLPNDRRLICLGITHFLKSCTRPTISLPNKIWQFYSTADSSTKGISFFYNNIRDKNTFLKTTAMRKWEDELGTIVSTEQWRHSFREIHRASHCVKHWELAIKMANRWHYTPYSLANYFPGTSPLCWRACGHTPTHAMALPHS